MQSRGKSALEACTNVAVGIVLAWGVTFIVFPWFGYEATAWKSLGISLVFTAVSLCRTYVLRRVFNRLETVASVGSTYALHPDVAHAFKSRRDAGDENSLPEGPEKRRL